MSLNNTCVIVIPIYKEFDKLEVTEKQAINRAFEIFTNRTICFVGPFKLDISPYMAEASRFSIHLKTQQFTDFYFKDIRGYNALLLSLEFYNAFLEYKYILIYQPDCWVFRDELDLWCSKGYDYIGAPWTDDINLERVINNRKKPLFKLSIFIQKALGLKKDWRVGNGGLALHNVKASIKVLQLFKNKVQKFSANEDLFWGIYMPLLYPFFKVPDEQDAIAFAFEKDPEKYFQLNKQQLPFGCHAWQKYNYEFWKQWICL